MTGTDHPAHPSSRRRVHGAPTHQARQAGTPPQALLAWRALRVAAAIGLCAAGVPACAATVGADAPAPPATPATSGADAPAQDPSAALPVTTIGGRAIGRAAFERWLDGARQRHRLPGVSLATIEAGQLRSLIVQGVADAATGEPVTTETRFEAASLSKPVFSRAWMAQVAAGRVGLDDPLQPRWGDLGLGPDPRANRLTARQLLSHQAGLPNWRADPRQPDVGFVGQPGQGLHYSGEGYDALARVLARALGTDDRGLAAHLATHLAAVPASAGAAENAAAGSSAGAATVPASGPSTVFTTGRTTVATPASPRAGFRLDDCTRGKAAPHRDGRRLRWTPCPTTVSAAGGLEASPAVYAGWLIGAMAGQGLPAALDRDWWRGQGVGLPADHPMRAYGLTDWTLGFARHTLAFGPVWLHTGDQPGVTTLAIVADDRQRALVVMTNADAAQAFLLELVGFLAEGR